MILMKELSFFAKQKLRFTDPERYKEYKFREKLDVLPVVNSESDPLKPVASFTHSGGASHLIYSLPTLFALAKSKPIHLFLKQLKLSEDGKQVVVNGMVKNTIEMLQPLMWYQQGITSCDPHAKELVDFDLDLIRDYPIKTDRGNVANWYFQVFAVSADLSKPWLQAKQNTKYSDAIVLSRGLKYRTPGISYSALKDKGRVVFVGLQQEFESMKPEVPQLEYVEVNDFLQMASIINSCKLFIGNQCFAYAIAEGLKVKRMLEVYPVAPTVVPVGGESYEFCFQEQFERLVEGVR
jgi:hypothetical protein